MVDVDRLLKEATADLGRAVTQHPIPEPPRSHRTNPWTRVAALATAGVALTLIVLSAPQATPPATTPGLAQPPLSSTIPVPTTQSPQIPTPQDRPAVGRVFDTQTGVVLLFDTGLNDIDAVDLDTGRVARSRVEGMRGGDPDFRLVRVGDHLVTGWGDIYASHVTSRASTHLGAATIFVPAAEPDRVWLISWPGGRIGVGGPPSAWQVDLNGHPVGDRIELMPNEYPIVGILGGLALRTSDGLTLWYADSGTRFEMPADGAVIPLDSRGIELVWCSIDCRELVITDTATRESERFPVPAGFDMFHPSFLALSAISPNQQFVAALVGDAGSGHGKGIWLHDRHSGEAKVLEFNEPLMSSIVWAPSSNHLFASSYSYGDMSTEVWMYDLRTGLFENTTLPIGGFLAAVAIDSSEAAAYFPEG